MVVTRNRVKLSNLRKIEHNRFDQKGFPKCFSFSIRLTRCDSMIKTKPVHQCLQIDNVIVNKNSKNPVVKKSSNVPTLQDIIVTSFKSSLKEFQATKQTFKVGDHVLARMKGYSPWPARIISFTKNRLSARCYFYGSHNNGSVTVNEIIPFQNGFEIIRLIAIRKPNDFIRGIREIEIEHGIPDDLSSLKEIENLE